MNEREALKLALEAMLNFPDDISDEIFEAIIAIKKVLAQPEQEPVAWLCTTHERSELVQLSWETFGQVFPLYATPPQRKPLTDEEIEDLYFDNFSVGQLKAFARAIEAAHGIKE